MLKQTIRIWLVAAAIILTALPARACVGRFLYVGATDSAEEKLLAEMLVILINERTGTTVKARYLDNAEQIYHALKSNTEESRVDIIIEDTGDAAGRLELARGGDLDGEYAEIKRQYEEQLAIIWLKPFGFHQLKGRSGSSVNAALVRRDVLTNFPLLPRVLNKLAGAIDDKVMAALLAEVDAGKKDKNVARDFLRSKKFI